MRTWRRLEEGRDYGRSRPIWTNNGSGRNALEALKLAYSVAEKIRSMKSYRDHAAPRLLLQLANDGVDTRSLQAYLGHRNIQNTTRYTALAPDRFKGFWRD
jgi:site-specific recombinase XerD